MTDKADNVIVKEQGDAPPLQSEALQLFQDNKAPTPSVENSEKTKGTNLPKVDIVDPNFGRNEDPRIIKVPKDTGLPDIKGMPNDNIIRNPDAKKMEDIMNEVMDPVIYGRPGKNGEIEHFVPQKQMDNFVEDLKDGEMSKENLEYMKKVLEKAGPERLQWMMDQINKQLAEKDVHTRLGLETKYEQASAFERAQGKGPLEENTYVTVAHLNDGKDGKGAGFTVKETEIASKSLPLRNPMPKPSPFDKGLHGQNKPVDPIPNLREKPIPAGWEKYRKRY